MSTDFKIKMQCNPITDLDYKKHLKVLQVCCEANVSLPEETAHYFGCMTDDYFDAENRFTQKDISFSIERPYDGLTQYVVKTSDIPVGVDKILFQFHC